MSEQPDKIKGKCACDLLSEAAPLRYHVATGLWDEETSFTEHWRYCPWCGYHLAADGFAYRMVRADHVLEIVKKERNRWENSPPRSAAGISYQRTAAILRRLRKEFDEAAEEGNSDD